MANLTGKTLGQYHIENRLAEGGAAVVYRAYQPSMERFVAIKVLKADLSKDPAFMERFSREGRMVAQLQHPHILPVIDFGQHKDAAYLVMILLEGGSLSHHLANNAPLALHECGRFLTQIASALQHAHSRGVVHRDLKPANVLLDEDANAYLTDFGIARLTRSQQQLTATGSLIGTPRYLSPEQAMGRQADTRSDIYALGIMLYEMVTGQAPFNADTPYGLIFKHINEAAPPPRSIQPDLAPDIEAVILRALEKDPRDRFQTPMALADAFAEVIPKAPKISEKEEAQAARLPAGAQAESLSEAMGMPTPAPTLTPSRMRPEEKIAITNYAGDPRERIPTTNGFLYAALRALEEVGGLQATEIILRFAGIPEVLDNPPPANLKLHETYTWKHYSDLNHAVVNYYGASGKEAALHLGRVAARWLVKDQPMLGLASMALRLMPMAAALRLSFNQFINTFTRIYGKAGIEIRTQIIEKPGFFLLAIKECPCCVGKKSNAPICWMWQGIILESGHIIKGKTLDVQQVGCQAMEHPYCVWKIGKKPMD